MDTFANPSLPEADDGESLATALERLADELMKHPHADPGRLLAMFPQHASQLDSLLPALALLADASQGEELGVALATAGPDMAGPLPRALGDFQIQREIGRGGMGVVYEAQQISLGRKVAVKVLPLVGMLDQRHVTRFQNEARAAATLHHPHIVPVYFVGDERGVHFYAMQLIHGQNLAEAIAAQKSREQPAADATHSNASISATPPRETAVDTAHGPQARAATLPEQRRHDYFRVIAKIGVQVARALDHAHAHGILHRDIKPANILLDVQGNAWVTDFGLARLEGDLNVTLTGDLLGTLRYMSPEQMSGKRVMVDHRTDVYSLGATLYELLTLRPVAAGSSREEILRQIESAEPIRPRALDPDIPRDLETIVLSAVAKYPDERYPDAASLADDLERFLRNAPIEAKAATLVDHFRRWSRSHRRAIVVALGLLAITSAAFALSTTLVTLSWRAESRSRQQAEQNLQVARQAIDEWYLEFADEWLADRAGLGEQQLEMIRKAADFYQQLQTDADDEPSRQFGVAAAKRRLSRIYRELDQPAQADREARQAAMILERLVDAPNAEPEYRQELANLLMDQHGSLSEDRGEDRRRRAERAIQLLTAARRDDPQNASLTMDLALAEGGYGALCLEEDQYEAAQRHLANAVALAEQAAAASPENLRCLRNLAYILHFAARSHLVRVDVHGTGGPRDGRRDEATKLYHRSLAIAREVTQRDPASIRNRRTLVQCLLDSMKFLSSEEAISFQQEAVREGEALLQRDSTRPDLRDSVWIAYKQLRQSYEHLNRFQDAHDTLRKYQPLGSWTPDDQRLEVGLLKKLNRLEEAQQILERLVALQISKVAQQDDLAAFALPLANDFEDLIAVLDQQGKQSESQAAHVKRDAFYQQLLERPIPSDPALAASAHFARGRILKFMRKDDEALVEYARVIECGSGPENALLPNAMVNRLGIFNERKQCEQSLAEAVRLTQLRPELPHGWAYRAFALDRLGRSSEALAHVDRAVELCHGAGWQDTRAMILWHLGRCQDAVQQCTQILTQESPSDRQDLPRYLLVNILCHGPTELRDVSRASQLAREIQNEGDRAAALSFVYFASGEWQQARDVMRAALDAGHRDARLLICLALTCCELNELEQAKSFHESALRAAESEPPVWQLEHAPWLERVAQHLNREAGSSGDAPANRDAD